jgi:hypothetical protein
MIAPKKINSFIALLLLAATFNSHSMEPEQQKSGWVALAGATIIRGYAAYKQFLSYIHSEPIEPFPFTTLPKDIQHEIIALLLAGATATSLKEAAFTINSLAQINHQLNELINDPKFCLSIIKNLAETFNCSDEEAAKALQTQEAKRRLKLQESLKKSLERGRYPADLPSGDIDLNFTYSGLDEYGGEIMTPLMIAIVKNNYYMIQLLPTLGANLNMIGTEGIKMTALMFAARYQHAAIIILFKCQNLNINQQDLQGNTALMHYLAPDMKHYWAYAIVPLFLDAGADPELANNAGLTPLQAAQQTGDQHVIDLIQDAIDNPTSPRLRRAQAKK